MKPSRHSYLGVAQTLALLAIVSYAGTAQAQYYAPEPLPPPARWQDALDTKLFVDVYGSINFGLVKPQQGKNQLRAYDTSNGFAISWVGADLMYDPDPVGATVSFRAGPTADRYGDSCLSTDRANNPCDASLGLQYVKQAYVSYKPGGAGGGLQLDLGKFDTLFGAEVAESQDNMNYTRGLLYWLGQPLFHTGLRAGWELAPEFSLNAMLVNGFNNSVDNNSGKTFGLQAVVSPNEALSISLGWVGGPEQDDTTTVVCGDGESYDPEEQGCAPDAKQAGMGEQEFFVDRGGANSLDAWRHLIDLVVGYSPVPTFSVLLNVDYGTEGVRTSFLDDTTENRQWYGGMLSAHLDLSEVWGVALRGEYYADPDGHTTGVQDAELVSATATLDAKLAESLLVRLEGRGDFSLSPEESGIFNGGIRDTQEHQYTATLGAVLSSF